MSSFSFSIFLSFHFYLFLVQTVCVFSLQNAERGGGNAAHSSTVGHDEDTEAEWGEIEEFVNLLRSLLLSSSAQKPNILYIHILLILMKEYHSDMHIQ